MVLKVISTSGVFDMTNPADQYGVFDDTILFLPGANGASVSTWEGDDTVYATRLNSITDLNVVALGFGNDRIFGGSARELVSDGSGNDYVNLGAGNDQVNVGSGNDTFIGGGGTDGISFLNANYDGQGSAVNNASPVTFDLAKTTAQNFGILGTDICTGFENATGGLGADRFFGNSAANIIDGYRGDDIIDGRAGNDKLNAHDGRDVLIGGAGGDILQLEEFSGPARDIVRYRAIGESGLGATTWDTITFFDKGGTATDDKIDLSLIDAAVSVAGNQVFNWRGSAGAFSLAGGEVRLVTSGADTLVYIDNDADAAAEMIIKVQGVTGLAKADFIL